ncbi:MAG: hypothetical protein VYB72_07430, partial [Planctomycetota bacterium]|nr:hypothetical protein [Planctomycetota bacterium]
MTQKQTAWKPYKSSSRRPNKGVSKQPPTTPQVPIAASRDPKFTRENHVADPTRFKGTQNIQF